MTLLQSKFTFPGRLLVFFTIVLTSGGFTWYLSDIVLAMEPGDRVFPGLVLIPVLLAGGAFFAVGFWLLRLLGVRVFRTEKELRDDDEYEDD